MLPCICIGSEKFRSQIKGNEIVYSEHIKTGKSGDASTANRMELTFPDGSKLMLEDRLKESDLSSSNNQEIERFVVTLPEGQEIIYDRDTLKSDSKNEEAIKYLKLGTKLYNDLRRNIKAQLDEGYYKRREEGVLEI